MSADPGRHVPGRTAQGQTEDSGKGAASFVLDSFAVLAYLNDEPGRDRIEAVLTAAGRRECRVHASMINIGEVLYITEREVSLSQAQAVMGALDQLPIEIIQAARQAVLAAAHIKANYRLSYADAFAVVASQATGATIVTGDREFTTVAHLVNVEWLPAS